MISKNVVLRNYLKFRRKFLCRRLFSQVTGLWLRQRCFPANFVGFATLLKKRLRHKCFPVNFARPATFFKKKIPMQVFSCESCEFFFLIEPFRLLLLTSSYTSKKKKNAFLFSKYYKFKRSITSPWLASKLLTPTANSVPRLKI